MFAFFANGGEKLVDELKVDRPTKQPSVERVWIGSGEDMPFPEWTPSQACDCEQCSEFA